MFTREDSPMDVDTPYKVKPTRRPPIQLPTKARNKPLGIPFLHQLRDGIRRKADGLGDKDHLANIVDEEHYPREVQRCRRSNEDVEKIRARIAGLSLENPPKKRVRPPQSELAKLRKRIVNRMKKISKINPVIPPSSDFHFPFAFPTFVPTVLTQQVQVPQQPACNQQIFQQPIYYPQVLQQSVYCPQVPQQPIYYSQAPQEPVHYPQEPACWPQVAPEVLYQQQIAQEQTCYQQVALQSTVHVQQQSAPMPVVYYQEPAPTPAVYCQEPASIPVPVPVYHQQNPESVDYSRAVQQSDLPADYSHAGNMAHVMHAPLQYSTTYQQAAQMQVVPCPHSMPTQQIQPVNHQLTARRTRRLQAEGGVPHFLFKSKKVKNAVHHAPKESSMLRGTARSSKRGAATVGVPYVRQRRPQMHKSEVRVFPLVAPSPVVAIEAPVVAIPPSRRSSPMDVSSSSPVRTNVHISPPRQAYVQGQEIPACQLEDEVMDTYHTPSLSPSPSMDQLAVQQPSCTSISSDCKDPGCGVCSFLREISHEIAVDMIQSSMASMMVADGATSAPAVPSVGSTVEEVDPIVACIIDLDEDVEEWFDACEEAENEEANRAAFAAHASQAGRANTPKLVRTAVSRLEVPPSPMKVPRADSMTSLFGESPGSSFENLAEAACGTPDLVNDLFAPSPEHPHLETPQQGHLEPDDEGCDQFFNGGNDHVQQGYLQYSPVPDAFDGYEF